MKRRTVASIPAMLLAGSTAAEWEPAAAEAAVAKSPKIPDPSTIPGGSSFESPAVTTDNLPLFFEQLKNELKYPLSWGTSQIRDFRSWQAAARGKVEEHLLQPPDDTPFNPLVVDELVTDSHVAQALVFNVTRHSRVRALALTPHGDGPFPAVLLLHDHGAKFDIGKEKLIEPWGDETRHASAVAWAAKYFSGRFVGNELAARGYAVLAVDTLGWGDRSGMAYEGQQALASNFFNLGSSLAGLMAREDVRAAALLAGLPKVDHNRVAALGFSMGGYRAWQVAALSDHVRVAVSACWMTTLAG